MAMGSWGFVGADWEAPDIRDNRYWDAIGEALKEKAAYVGHGHGAAFLNRVPTDNPYLYQSFDISSFDTLLKEAVVHYYATTATTLLELVEEWLYREYDYDGTIALDKATGNAVYVKSGGTIWKVNAYIGSWTAAIPDPYTWESLCIDKLNLSGDMLCTLDRTHSFVHGNDYLSRWLASRRKILDSLTLCLLPIGHEWSGSLEYKTKDTDTYRTQTDDSAWISTWYGWDRVLRCYDDPYYPPPCTSDTTNVVEGALSGFVSTWTAGASAGKIHDEYIYNRWFGEGCSTFDYRYEKLVYTIQDQTNQKDIDVYGSGVGHLIVNNFKRTTVNGVAGDWAKYGSVEMSYDLTRGSRVSLTSLSVISTPTITDIVTDLGYDCYYNPDTGESYSQTGERREGSTSIEVRGNQGVATQSQINSDPMYWASVLIDILGSDSLDFEVPTFNFHT
jgi:hypothetical protein